MTADVIPFADHWQARRIERERARTCAELERMQAPTPIRHQLAQQRLELSAWLL